MVNLGCGLDTRPWRLALPQPERVTWYDVDYADVIRFKRFNLAISGGQVRSTDESEHAGDVHL